MGEELEFSKLFVICDDGRCVPFEGIKPMDIVCTDEVDEELYNSLVQEGTINFEFDMTKRQHRKAMKAFKAQLYGHCRRIRHEKRMKELARRRRLKGAKWQ